jgi:hypothetical protein
MFKGIEGILAKNDRAHMPEERMKDGGAAWLAKSPAMLAADGTVRAERVLEAVAASKDAS